MSSEFFQKAQKAFNSIARTEVLKKIRVLESEIAEERVKRDAAIYSYLEKHPNDIEGARKIFGIIPVDEELSWYRYEMM